MFSRVLYRVPMFSRIYVYICFATCYVVSGQALAQADDTGRRPVSSSATAMNGCAQLQRATAAPPCLTVTANRLEQTAAEQTNAVSVLTQEDIARLGVVTLGEALQYLPGVQFGVRGGVGSTSTLRVRGGETGQLLVLLDGVPMSDPSTPGRTFEFNRMVLDSVARIELVRGAQSVAYGSAAVGGVVNVITQTPRADGTHIKTALNYGARETLKIASQLQHKQGNVFLSLEGAQYDTEGFSRTVFGEERDGATFSSLRARAQLQPHPSLSLRMLGDYNTARSEYDAFRADGPQYEKRQQYVVQTGLTWQPHSQWKQDLMFAAMRIKRTDMPSNSRYIGTRYYIEQTTRARLWQERVEILLGGHGEWERYDDERMSRPSAHLAGGHALFTIEPMPQLYLNAGIRLESHKNFGSVTSWQTGASYTLPAIDTTLRTSYGTAFRAPSLYQLYNQTYGNLALMPEKSRHFDVGLRQSVWDKRLVMELGYFQLRSRDQIGFTSPDGYFNLRKSSSQGLEASLQWHILPQLVWRSDYTFTRSVSKPDGNDILLAPKQNWFHQLQWTYQRLRLHTDIRFVGKQKDFGNVRLPSYALWRIGGAYHWSEQLMLEWRVDNLLNKRYQPIATYRGAPRGVFVGLKARW